MKCCSGSWKKRHSTEMVQLLAPLTDNPNAPDEGGETPIHLGAWNGYTKIVKILVNLQAMLML